LELLLLETAAKSQHILIEMQFIFQNYLSQFSGAPTADRFRVCQDLFNRILAAQNGTVDTKFRQHIGPAAIAVGGFMGAIGVPAMMGVSGDVAGRQARRERIFEDEPDLRQSLHRSRSMNVKTMPISPATQDSTFLMTNSSSLDVRRPVPKRSSATLHSSQRSSSGTHFSNKHSALMSRSQPNLQPPSPPPPRSHLRSVSPSTFTDENIIRTLRSHYYSTQSQFLQCLQDISLRLRLVPKVARQSALRIELAELDKWLPADVCLVNLCPSNDVHDRIVQVVATECTILNSAERVFPLYSILIKVPYLLLVEVLKGDLTFSPSRPRNRKHFRDLMLSNPSSRQFDLSSTTKEKLSHDIWENEITQLNSSEGEDGDLGLRDFNEDVTLEFAKTSPIFPPNITSGNARIDSPRILPRSTTPVPYLDSKGEEMDNLNSHIRSAATMLAQLNSKNLPRADAIAIRARILAEMESLEEQRLAMSIATEDTDTSIERTMVDKEDPSAAVFAEEWSAKRERIRKMSAWGNLPGWELCSVIVKSDAQMEAVGTQLILGLKRIWEKDSVDVWLRRYSIWRVN
jgi:phosphatidylinositol 4-kinase B